MNEVVYFFTCTLFLQQLAQEADEVEAQIADETVTNQ